VRVKKPKAPRRSSRYLLQADHKLQKLSLKKISSRTAKPKKRPRPVRPATAERPNDVVRLPWTLDSQAVALIAIVVVMFGVTFAVLVAAHQPTPQSEIATIAATPATDAPPAVEAEKAAAPRLKATEPVVAAAPRPVEHAAPATISTYGAAASSTTAMSVEPVRAASTEPTRKASETASRTAAVEPSAKAEMPNMALVTITGCLERNDGMFWLNDTAGVEAPTSRSWKSGFLKKHAAPIAVVDADNGLKLPSHVGHRVAATGTITNREMRARSLQLVTSACS
jgi:hypothetical protein